MYRECMVVALRCYLAMPLKVVAGADSYSKGQGITNFTQE